MRTVRQTISGPSTQVTGARSRCHTPQHAAMLIAAWVALSASSGLAAASSGLAAASSGLAADVNSGTLSGAAAPDEEPAAAGKGGDKRKGASEQAEARTPTLIVDLESNGVDAAKAALVTDLIGHSVARWPNLEVTTTNDVRRVLKFEADKEVLGCDPGSSCLANLAGSFGARYLVTGTLGNLGEILIVQLNLFDADNARIVGRVKLQVRSDTELANKLDDAVVELFEPTAGRLPEKTDDGKPDEKPVVARIEVPNTAVVSDPSRPPDPPVQTLLADVRDGSSPTPGASTLGGEKVESGPSTAWLGITFASVAVAAGVLAGLALGVAAFPVAGFYATQSQIGDAEVRHLAGDAGAFDDAKALQGQADAANLAWRFVGVPSLAVAGVSALVMVAAGVTSAVFWSRNGATE